MRIALLLVALGTATEVALARSSGRPSSAPRRSSSGSGGRSRGGSGSGSRGGGSSKSRRSDPIDDYDDEDPLGFDVEDDDDDVVDEYDDDDYDEEDYAPRRGGASRGGRSGGRGGGPPPKQQSRGGRGRPSPARYDEYDEDYDDDYPPRRGSGRGGPPPSRGSGRGRSNSRGGGPPRRGGNEGRMVSYNQPRGRRGYGGPPPPSAFSRGLSAIRDSMPDPAAVKDTMVSATKAAQERTSQLSSNIYREVKGLTSSELEQVMLKSTRPDDTPVKSKHVERLVGVTYQISGKYDIYDAVLRKLWNKMAEKDIRTKLKSVYVLHRFSVDGGPDHQEALKQRLRALRKTKDPKRSSGGRGGTRYFDSKVLIGQDNDPETQGFRAFLSRYAHYVLTRAQTFGGIFNEISLAQSPPSPSPSKKGRKSKGGSASSSKPKNPPLCEEHLKFAQMVLKAGLACTLHDGEDSESTAMCVERVAADLMGLTAAVATALKRELKSTTMSEDEETVKQWCEFYADELLPETKKFCKKVTGKLDTYGLYLPSRISSSLSQELLEKGLKLGGGDEKRDGDEEEEEDAAEEREEPEAKDDELDEEEVEEKADEGDASIAMSAASTEAGEDEYDEYEYDEYDEYDD